MKAIHNGIILTEHEEIHGKSLFFDEKIACIADKDAYEVVESYDAQGHYVAPGLVDVHIHGYHGEDMSDGSPEGVRVLAKGILENGVTSFLPTTMTVSWAEIEASLNVARELKPQSLRPDFIGAEILGVHAEGPFINPERKGAQAAEAILAPDADKILPHRDIIKLITIAPEMPGGLQFIKTLVEKTDIAISIGHSSASFEQAMEAIAAGASHVTHLFNAQTPLNHRNPGVVGAGLASDAYCELIADTFHVHAGLYPMLLKAKGGQLVLITDCTRAGGLKDGEYTLGGQPIFVKGIECRLKDGTIAGSVLKLNDAVRNLMVNSKLSLREAIHHASLSPAMSIHVEDRKGSIAPRKDADIIIMTKDCLVQKTFVRGTLKYQKGN